MAYTLKNPWAMRYEPITTVWSGQEPYIYFTQNAQGSAGKTESYTSSSVLLIIYLKFFPGTKGPLTHQDGYPVVVEIGSCILKGFHSPREEKEGKDSCGSKTKENSNFA